MTCIVGLVSGGKVYLGGDSAGVSEYNIVERGDAKVFRNGPFVMGFTSSFRMGQLLRYSLSVPEQTSEQTDDRFMCTTFIDTVRKCLKDGGYARKKDGEETGGIFLVGYKDRMYKIESDFQVGRSRRGYEAVGCGENYALASLWETSNTKARPKIRVLRALKCAEEFSAGVRSPFKVLVGK